MSTNINDDGGPTFPMSGDPAVDFDRGMSLRDYFAAHIAQGMAASAYWSENIDGKPEHMEALAKAAFQMADTMLKARDVNDT